MLESLPWSSRHHFWTLRVNKEQVIVKACWNASNNCNAKWTYHEIREDGWHFAKIPIACSITEKEPNQRKRKACELEFSLSAVLESLIIYAEDELDETPENEPLGLTCTRNERAIYLSSEFTVPTMRSLLNRSEIQEPTVDSVNMLVPPISISTRLALSLYKPDRTILKVTQATYAVVDEYVLLSLRPCSTNETFFKNVITAGGRSRQVSENYTITVSFDWKDDEALDKKVYLQSPYPDRFKRMLHMIDEAPCWEESDPICMLTVYIGSR